MSGPETIYLQDAGDYSAAAELEVTWCVDPQDPNDTKYIRADLHASAIARAERAEAELEEARAEGINDQLRLCAAAWRRKWWQKRAKMAEAERDTLRAKLQSMHRRAQSVEGKLDRTMAILRAILRATDPKKYHWVVWWVGAALRHSRSNSGIAGEIAYSFLRKENEALYSTLAVAEEALRAADGYLDKGLDQVARNVTRAALAKIAALKGGAE